MSIRQLQYFIWLFNERHFGRAARRCHVSQSTLSMQIAKLEEFLGARLFDRDRRRVRPTPAAVAIAPLVGSVLDAVDRIRDTVRAGVEDRPSNLSIGNQPFHDLD